MLYTTVLWRNRLLLIFAPMMKTREKTTMTTRRRNEVQQCIPDNILDILEFGARLRRMLLEWVDAGRSNIHMSSLQCTDSWSDIFCLVSLIFIFNIFHRLCHLCSPCKSAFHVGIVAFFFPRPEFNLHTRALLISMGLFRPTLLALSIELISGRHRLEC